MSIPDQEQTQKELCALEDGLIQSVKRAWSDWLELGGLRGGLGKTARANFIHGRWVFHAETILGRIHRFKPVPSSTTKYLNYQDAYLLRLKKGNRQGLSRNYPTQLALAFNDPRERSLPGIPESQRIDVVYILNSLETYIDDVRIVARDGDAVAWQYSILKAAINHPIGIPLAAQPSTPQKHSQVRPIKQEQDQENLTGNNG